MTSATEQPAAASPRHHSVLGRTFSALEHRGYRYLWLSSTGAALTMQMQLIARGYLACGVAFDRGEWRTRGLTAVDFLWSQLRRGEAGILSAFVFYIGRDQPPLTPNAEVAATYWIPIDHLWAPENRTTVEWDAPVGRFRLPGVQYETRVIWGLTYRVLESFFEAIGKSLPARGPIVG